MWDDSIREFIASRIVPGDLLLPVHYPELEQLDGFQTGFRTHGHSGESLVSSADGAWQPGWYVIAMTGLDDPIFIDETERGSGYPVYTAPHGAGRWDPMAIAPSLAAFSRTLAALAKAEDDPRRFENIIAAEPGFPDTFWREVIEERQRSVSEEDLSPSGGDYDPEDYAEGDLIVTDIGSQKLKAVGIISKACGLSLKETLALVAAPEVKAGSGMRIRLRRLQGQLEAVGATVIFRPRASLSDR
jgi:hypothetical protein